MRSVACGTTPETARTEACRLIALAIDLLHEHEQIARDYLGLALEALAMSREAGSLEAAPASRTRAGSA